MDKAHERNLIYLFVPREHPPRLKTQTDYARRFTFYTYKKPNDISQLNGKKIPIQVNGVVDLEAKVFMVRPFLMGYQIWFNLGNHKVDEYTKFLKEFNRFEIKILDGYGFKAEKYFDITANNWELKDAGDAFQKMKKDCLEISATKNKKIT